MVDESGRALITDFGLATIARNPHSQRSALGDEGHTVRWSAPEILLGERASKEADVFSFGMVIIEVRDDRPAPCQPTDPLMKIFTGSAPFGGERTPAAMAKIMARGIPERPSHPGFSDHLWELTKWCLESVPSNRPRMEEVQEVLQGLVGSGRTLPDRVYAWPLQTLKSDTDETLPRRVVMSSPLKQQERCRVSGQSNDEKIFASGKGHRRQRVMNRATPHLPVEKLRTTQPHPVRPTNTERVLLRLESGRGKGTLPFI